MPVSSFLYPDYWEVHEQEYEEIQNYYKEEQEYYEKLALQRAG